MRPRTRPDTSEVEAQRVYKREYMREYRARYPEKAKQHVRNSNVKAKYGLTMEAHDAMWREQGQVCASCKTDDNGGRRWSVDHDHETGVVRGILCMKCNTALGMLNDSPYLVSALLQYIAAR